MDAPVITTQYYESTPVLCRDELAKLGRKTNKLKQLLDAAATSSCQFVHEGKSVIITFANEANAAIAIHPANANGTAVTYYIEPKRRFAYTISDANGAVTDNWQRLANEYLGGDEPSYVSLPLLLLLTAIRMYQPTEQAI